MKHYPFLLLAILFLTSCNKTEVGTTFSQTSDVTDDVDEELAEFLASLPAEDFSEEDFILPNGTTMYDCLAAYAPAILDPSITAPSPCDGFHKERYIK